MSKGKVYIVSGPSGVGKDTLLKEVFKICPEIKFSISSITRDMRPGEIEGEKYNFISREKFEDMIAQNQLLEYNCFVGNYYGTPKAPVVDCIENGDDMIIEIDVNGAAQIRSNMPEAVGIFILPPSFESLKNRLIGRATDSMEVIEKRIELAKTEIERAVEYDYIVVNDDLQAAVSDFAAIINADRLKISRQTERVNKILNNI